MAVSKTPPVHCKGKTSDRWSSPPWHMLDAAIPQVPQSDCWFELALELVFEVFWHSTQ